jgi:hypothetical protein
MFATLYRCARTAARHENGPAAQSRFAYLEHLAAEIQDRKFRRNNLLNSGRLTLPASFDDVG